jgi:hypothetical protein
MIDADDDVVIFVVAEWISSTTQRSRLLIETVSVTILTSTSLGDDFASCGL